MAIVSNVPFLEQSLHSIYRNDIGALARFMESDQTPPPCGDAEEKIYVAVGKDASDCKSSLLWASKYFGAKKICLLHVRQPAQLIPLMGGKFPANMLNELQVEAYRDLEREKMHKMLNEYLLMCRQLGVPAEKLYIEMENVENGIVELVARHGIKRLVMGATAGMNKGTKTVHSKKAIFLSQHAHISCHIWFVCKNCLIQTRECSLVERCESPLTSSPAETSPVDHFRFRSSKRGQRVHAILTSPVKKFISRAISHGSSVATVDSLEGSSGIMMPLRGTEDDVNDESEVGSLFSLDLESEEDLRRSSLSNQLENEEQMAHQVFNSLQQAMAEAENAKREAREESFKRQKAEEDATEAINKAKESERLYGDVIKQKKELEVQLVRHTLELNRTKNEQDEVAKELKTALAQKMSLEGEIFVLKELLLRFGQERDKLQVERDNAVHEAQFLKKRIARSKRLQLFSDFSFSEIEAATCNFDRGLVIGGGGYGTVYKGFLRNTDVAIKVLNSTSLQRRSEFQHEVEILSRMRHPNLVTLIGTCPEAWSLVYEYLPNGNLHDRLSCKDNTSPLSWQTRIRIAIDICSVLIFLHSNKPHGIVHGDLKPANILLDANMISKLGDFGISQSLTGGETSPASGTPCYKTNNPMGTLAYIDPEFLSTGKLTPKSDVYSFGIVLLQLLTWRQPLGIAKEVQEGLDSGSLGVMLDSSAGDWPFVQAKDLAQLALRCCDINRQNRPDLMSEVWRVLEPMKEIAAD